MNQSLNANHPQSVLTQLAANLQAKGWMLATAESCTGGLVAAACTDLAGSSTWFERGFVTYSNEAKAQMLGVDPALIATHGAVSQPVAQAMAEGAVQHSGAQVSIATTGIAGPGGGSTEKPVGLVWFGWSTPYGSHTAHRVFPGDRAAVRAAAVTFALEQLLHQLQPSN